MTAARGRYVVRVTQELGRLESQGAAAFHNGESYNENPHRTTAEAKARLAWSTGFNGARASHLLMMRESQ